MNVCAIIPSRNHSKVTGSIVEKLRTAGIRVFIIDDASTDPTRQVISALHDGEDVTVLRRDTRGGKGAAVLDGFNLAIKAGFTHAIQVDADGQHDLTALPEMLRLQAANPKAVICGQPIYDRSVPKVRKMGRWLTHMLVWVETLSFQIKDSMCGFRSYPLAAVQELMAKTFVAHYMDFDTDIIVRLFWQGTRPVMLPVAVTYPPDNTSNFDVLKDNVRMTKLHARLLLGMVLRTINFKSFDTPDACEPVRWNALRERGRAFLLRRTVRLTRFMDFACQQN